MSDPSTTRTLVALSNALDLNIDHLDVAVAYLNGVLPTDQRFFCLPPPGFEETAGYGWYMLKGLYGTKQGGALWAKRFATGYAASNHSSSRLETSACVMFFVRVMMERQSILTNFADSLSSPMKSSSFCA